MTVDSDAQPVVIRLGLWISHTTSRRDKLTADQFLTLAELGVGGRVSRGGGVSAAAAAGRLWARFRPAPPVSSAPAVTALARILRATAGAT